MIAFSDRSLTFRANRRASSSNEYFAVKVFFDRTNTIIMSAAAEAARLVNIKVEGSPCIVPMMVRPFAGETSLVLVAEFLSDDVYGTLDKFIETSKQTKERPDLKVSLRSDRIEWFHVFSLSAFLDSTRAVSRHG